MGVYAAWQDERTASGGSAAQSKIWISLHLCHLLFVHTPLRSMILLEPTTIICP